MERDYLKAALPDPVTLLGKQLLPFSIGHYMWLTRLENGFLCATEQNFGDLVSGVLVCSRSYRENEIAFSTGDHGDLKQWGEETPEFDFEKKAKAFRDYIQASIVFPELHEIESNARMPGACFIQRVRLTLQSKCGMSFDEALQLPYALAMADYFAFWEMEGAIKIFSEDDAATLDGARKVRDEILAEIEAAKNGD